MFPQENFKFWSSEIASGKFWKRNFVNNIFAVYIMIHKRNHLQTRSIASGKFLRCPDSWRNKDVFLFLGTEFMNTRPYHSANRALVSLLYMCTSAIN